MAEYALIDGYLTALRTQVRWRGDVEDLVAEVEDHLYSTVERFEARGTDTDLAQRQTLDRFGDPNLMAEAFASTPRGGIAVPTKFTKTAGLAALVGAALWMGAVLIGAVFDNVTDDWSTAVYLTWTAFIMSAGAMTAFGTAGLRERLGGLGRLGLAGLIILVIGVVLSFLAWAAPFYMTLLGVGMLFVAIAAWPLRVAPRMPTIAYGGGMLVGAVTFTVARALEVGSVDEWGDYPLASWIGITVGFLITAAGLVGLGLWLRSEEPADIDATGPAVNA